MTDGAPQAVNEQEILAQIAALRDASPGVGESAEDHRAKSEALWKKLYPPESAAPADTLTPKPEGEWTPPGDTGLPPLPDGHAWDVPVVRGFYETAGRYGVPSAQITQALSAVTEAVGDSRRWTAADLQAELVGRVGLAKFEEIDAQAGEAARHLPAKLRADLKASGHLYHPRVVEALARIGDKLLDPLTETGLARLKEIYSEEG